MSALGQKQACVAHKAMSAVCQKRNGCMEQTASLFDHLVGTREQHRRHREAKRLGGLEINDQLEFGGPFRPADY